MVGEGAGLVVVNIETEPGDEGAGVAQSLAPFGGEGGLAVAGRGSEDDQTARSRIVEGPHQPRSLNRKLANRRRHGLGQGNTRQLYQNGVPKILLQTHPIHLRALPTHRTDA